MKSRILLVEDDLSFAEVFKDSFDSKNYKVILASNGAEAYGLINKTEVPFDVVVIDYHLPDLAGTDLAEAIRKRNPKQQILFSTGDLTLSTLQILLESGLANGFIPKNIVKIEMQKKVKASVDAYRMTSRLLVMEHAEDVSQVESDLKSIGIIGRSQQMHQVYEKVKNYQAVDVDVLILGETGTGKELVAKALARPGQPFFAVNCATFSESAQFVESELFGHVKGSFTDAKEDKIGIFEQAQNGVVFLDEIHTLTKSAQLKILRALQERRIRRFGDNREREIRGQFRIIYATKPDLEKLVANGLFTPDLYYRINKARIEIPKLAERQEDIEPLVSYFTAIYNQKNKTRKHFESSTLSELMAYSWPGNVRELESLVQRLLIDSKEEVITLRHLQPEIHRIRTCLDRSQGSSEESLLGLELAKRNFEKHRIIATLKKSKTSKVAAEFLGMPRTTLLSKMERLGIDPCVYLST